MKHFADRLLIIATALVTGLLFVTVTVSGVAAQTQSFSTAPVRSPQGAAPSGEIIPPFTLGSNVNVTNKAGAQSETSVAVDPTNTMHVLESVNDLTSTATVYESFDGGATWANSNLTTNGAFCYDTWLGFNRRPHRFSSPGGGRPQPTGGGLNGSG